MTASARALYGAAVGALLSLLIHPVSRPYLTSSLSSWGPSIVRVASPLVIENLRRLPQPKNAGDLEVFSVWMIASAASLNQGRTPARADLLKLAQVAGLAGQADARNAFWPQMKAVFLFAAGNKSGAAAEWKRASNMEVWNDIQTPRLLGLERALAAESGADLAWQIRLAYRFRSSEHARAIAALARALVEDADVSTPAGRTIRFETAMNARLMREGARSIDIGWMASDMLLTAAYPPGVNMLTSFRRRLLARQALELAFEQSGDRERAFKLRAAYSNNDSWSAFVGSADRDQDLVEMAALSVSAATVPGASVIAALFGATLWLAGALVLRYPRLQFVFKGPIAPLIGIILAIWIYHSTQLVLASITAVLCFAFLVFSPSAERSHPPDDLGPLFGIVVAIIGGGLYLVLSAFVVGVATPGVELLGEVGVPKEYYGGSTLFLGLAGIMLGLLLLTAPSWAVSERIATPKVAGRALRALGSRLCGASLAIAIFSTPLAVYVDQQVADKMTKMLENEPNYYLIRES